MDILYKQCDFDLPSRLTEERQIFYKFSDIFPNENDENLEENNKYNLHLILDLIDDRWTSRSNDFDPFPLPETNELIDILTKLCDLFRNNCPEDELQHYKDSFYYLIASTFDSYQDNLMVELIFNIIIYSRCEFNEILIPLFSNFQEFLKSCHFSDEIIIDICIQFIYDQKFFDIIYKDHICKEFFKIILTSGDETVIKHSFYFLSYYLEQFQSFIGKDIVTQELDQMLEMTLIFIQSLERNELLPPSFLLLNTIFLSKNQIIYEKAKEYGFIEIISSLFHKQNPEIFLATLKLLDEIWPDSELFDDSFIYERFQAILQKKDIQVDSDDDEQITIPEKTLIVGIDVLRHLIPNHFDQFKKYDIIDFLLKDSLDLSFQLKISATELLLDYLTHMPIQERRDFMNDYFNGTNKVAENSINLIIDVIESENLQCISLIIPTFILLITNDHEFWIELLSTTNIINLFERMIESQEEKIKGIIEPLLNLISSHTENTE